MPSPQLLRNLVRGAGVVGAATVGTMATQDQAEAMPPGVFQPIRKAATGVVSSALKRLKGRTVKGKVIQDIRKSKDWRHIIFEDGTEQVVTKNELHQLTKAKGTQTYVQKFKEANEEAKTVQALKSMQMRESHVRNNPFTPRRQMRQLHKDYLKGVRSYGVEQPDTAFVTREGKHYQMPREYAEHLEDLGILKIVRGRAEKKALKSPARSRQEVEGVASHFNSMHKEHQLKSDGSTDLSALQKPPIYQFTAKEGPAKGASFNVEEPTYDAIKKKLDHMIEIRKPKQALDLIPAGIGVDGKLYKGKLGELHGDMYPFEEEIRKAVGEGPSGRVWKSTGWVDPSGKYITSKEALKRVQRTHKIKPTTPDGLLDAEDYVQQVLNKRKPK